MTKHVTDLEYIDSSTNSSKFWRIERDGVNVTTTWGRIGTAGQNQDKSFSSEAAAQDFTDKKISEKLMKGYVDRGGSTEKPVLDTSKAVSKLYKIAQQLADADPDPDLEPVLQPPPKDDGTVTDFAALAEHIKKPDEAAVSAALDAVAPGLEAALEAKLGKTTHGLPTVRPMLPDEVSADDIPKYVEDPTRVFQPKLDGHRVMLHVTAGTVAAYGRGGQRSQHEPRFLTAPYAQVLTLADCVLDGELIENTFWLFDLPVHPGFGINLDSPYEERLNTLTKLFNTWSPDPERYRLLNTAYDEVEKAQMALDLLRNRNEGVIIKTLSGKYRPARRNTDMLKAKFVKTADVIVTDIGHGGHDNYVLSVYRDGALIEMGRCSAIGKAKVNVGDVIEVRYLYVGNGNRLYQPRMMGVRTDKKPEECVYSQFDHAHVNKEVPA